MEKIEYSVTELIAVERTLRDVHQYYSSQDDRNIDHDTQIIKEYCLYVEQATHSTPNELGVLEIYCIGDFAIIRDFKSGAD